MNIIGRPKIWFTFSAILILLGVFAFASNFGIDFTGGTVLILRFEQSANIGSRLSDVRSTLNQFNFRESTIQVSGDTDVIMRTEPIESDTRNKIIEELQKSFGKIEVLEADTIGPVIGKELRGQAFWALLLATIGILVFVSIRFEFKYAVAATLALWHDAIITVGIIALLWRSVDASFIAAILTIMGYSINDTIVIFDRIRENLLKPRKGQLHFYSLINDSILQTMSRSINTVLTVIFMNVCLLIFGGVTLKDFALTLLIGFSLGAYSSIFIASPILVLMEKKFGGQKTRKA